MNCELSCEHVQLIGQAFYGHEGASGNFFFAPDVPVVGCVPRFYGRGVAQLMPDGTFDFVYKPKQKSKSTLIRKLAHGRASLTKDGAIQLTLKVFCDENLNIGDTLAKEAFEASEAVRNLTPTLTPSLRSPIAPLPTGNCS